MSYGTLSAMKKKYINDCIAVTDPETVKLDSTLVYVTFSDSPLLQK